MGDDSVLKSWYGLQQLLQRPGYPAATSSALSLKFTGHHPQKINDYVYEVSKPEGRPSIELVFFHGLQLERSKDAHLTTWLTEDGSDLWLKWILDFYPEARILLVSYDAFIERTRDQGNMDMFLTCENLIQDLTMGDAQVGQAGCPVALVGHCIGGLVMKELCIALNSTVGTLQYYDPDNHAQTLFLNISGLFFYGCPHHGSKVFSAIKRQGEFLKEVTILNKVAERRNSTFQKLNAKRDWTIYGIGEGLPTKLGQLKGVIVPEASARGDVDKYYTVAADHFNVSRTKSKNSSSFGMVQSFIGEILEKDKKLHIPEIDVPTTTVGLEERLEAIMQELEGAQRLAIVGMPGTGKSTLAKIVYNNPCWSYDYTCFLSDVKKFMGNRDDPSYLKEEIIKNLYYKGKKELSPKDSRRLFCHHAFGQQDTPEHYKDYVKEILEVLQGLPLGLVVVGTYLKGTEDLRLWHNVLERYKLAKPLEGEKNDRLWSVMTTIYEDLQEEEQQIFLDIAICFHGENVEDVKQAWRYCGWAKTAEIALTNLKERNFVTIEKTNMLVPGLDEPQEVECIRMHEVLRRVGKSTACMELDIVTTHSRVHYDILNPLPATWPFHEETSKVKVLMISYRTLQETDYPRIKMEELHRLKELRVLWLHGVSLTGPCDFLPDNLAYMRISYSNWSDALDWRFEGISRVVSLIPCLPRCFETSREHVNLRYMEIIHCQQLEGFLNSLGSLQGLKDLRLLSCSCFKTLQSTLWQLRALPRFEISHHDWKALVAVVGQLWAVKELVIRKCSKHGCPTICEQIEFLESLDSSGLLQRVENVDLPIYAGYSCGQMYEEVTGFAYVFVRYLEHQPNQERGAFWLEENEDLGRKILRILKSVHLFLKDFTKLQPLLHFLGTRLGIRESEIMMYDSEPYRQRENYSRHKDGIVSAFITDPTKLKSFLDSLERRHSMHVRILIANIPLEFKVLPDILQQFREVMGVLWDGNSLEDSRHVVLGLRALHRGDIHSGQTRDGNCARQLLTVRCSRRSSPSSASSSQTYSPEMIGAHSFQQQIGDCFVKMPEESECEMMSTRVERSISIPVQGWDDTVGEIITHEWVSVEILKLLCAPVFMPTSTVVEIKKMNK
ncbi:unnamed protein product [Calypogeia fissa]